MRIDRLQPGDRFVISSLGLRGTVVETVSHGVLVKYDSWYTVISDVRFDAPTDIIFVSGNVEVDQEQ